MRNLILYHVANMCWDVYDVNTRGQQKNADTNRNHGYEVHDWRVDEPSGFLGAIYRMDGFTVVAYAGTDMWSLADLKNDAQLAAGLKPQQFTKAVELIQLVKDTSGWSKGQQIVAVGHSLGGFLAQMVGLSENIPFAAINAPGISSKVARVCQVVSYLAPLFGPGGIIAGILARAAGSIYARATTPNLSTRGAMYRASGDPVSKIGIPLARDVYDVGWVPGPNIHGIPNFTKHILKKTDWALRDVMVDIAAK